MPYAFKCLPAPSAYAYSTFCVRRIGKGRWQRHTSQKKMAITSMAGNETHKEMAGERYAAFFNGKSPGSAAASSQREKFKLSKRETK